MSAHVGIVGGGTMGLAAAWAVARRGVRVSVYERHHHHHELGSHGGFTRVIRHAYHEGSDYVRLVSEADRAWTGLGERQGDTLLERCGLLEFGAGDDPQYAAANAALRAHDLAHEIVDTNAARERWPFRVPQGWTACFSPDAGYLRVGPCLDGLRAEARDAGASFFEGARVREVTPSKDGPRVLLEEGAVHTFSHVVVAAGAYSASLLPGVLDRAGTRVDAIRRVLMWTRPPAERRPALEAMPAWGAFVPEGFFYGFPYNREGIEGLKLACHENADPAQGWIDDPVDPDHVRREIDPRDIAPLTRFLENYLPSGRGPVEAAKVCLYGNTKSGDFLIDTHPDDARVLMLAGFSGHGFKFAPVVGELAADLLFAGESQWSLNVFDRAAHTI